MTAPEEGKNMTSLDATESNYLGKLSLEEIHKSNSNFLTELVCIQQTETYLSGSRNAETQEGLDSNFDKLGLSYASGINRMHMKETQDYPSEGSEMISIANVSLRVNDM